MPIKRHQLILFYLILLIFLPYSVFSQFTADFTSNTSSGCSPLSVTFNANYNGATTYFYDFGNGNVADSSTAFATFVTPGDYTVQLTVTEGSSADISTLIITVFNDPVANLTFIGQTNNGCQPSLVTFADNSSLGDAAITSWLWDYGDGYTQNESSSTDVSHNYGYSGDYSVSLEVTDANGCSDDILINNLVHISDLPFVSFYADEMQFCEIPGAVNFTNASTGYGSLSSSWDFGDLFTSILSNPSHNYTDYGYYDVTLSVTDGIGCSNELTLSSYIQIDSVRAIFSLPDTMCTNDTAYILNSSIAANTFAWDWVVGSSNSHTPTISIAQGGTFIVTLDASLNGICNDIHTDTIFVESSVTYYVPSQWYICELPTEVTFNNQSVTNNSLGFANIEWYFELYGAGSGQSPTSVFTPNIIYDYEDTINKYNHYTYFTSLDVETPFGCTGHWEDTIVVWLPVPRMTISQNTSCVPSEVLVSDTSFYDSPYDSITSWIWDFNNFSPPQYGQNPLVETYLDSGLYEISMAITTAYGCQDTAVTSFSCGYQQNADFIMLSDDTICGSEMAEFLSTSTDTAIIQSYYWEYSDGEDGAGQHTLHPPYQLGWTNAKLTVSHYGCNDSYTMYDAYYALGPIGSLHVTNNCDNPSLYHFGPNWAPYNGFVGVDHFYWDFSDGSPLDSVNQSGSHLYTTSPLDTFIYLTLVSDVSGCVKRDSFQIHVREPLADFIMDTTKICPGDTILFDPILSEQYFEFTYAWAHNVNFQWNFDDGLQYGPPNQLTDDMYTVGSISHVFYEPGVYNVRLIVYSMYNCPDTVYHPIRVYGTDINPEVTPPSGCTPITCSFADNSVSDTTIVSWEWSFGQGDSSFIQNPTDIVAYTVDGSYYVSLLVTDELGCVAFDSVEVVASTPFAEFFVSNSIICYGDTIFFIDSSITYSSAPLYIWDFGDGASSYDQNPFHIYEGGQYSVTLNIVDGVCPTSYVLPLDIRVEDPNTEITGFVDGIEINSQQVICAPEHIIFNANPHPSYFSTMIWRLGDGTISQAEAPGHNYTVPGNYPITLKVYTDHNCVAYADTVFLEVVLVEADLDLSDHEICLGDSIDLVVTNMLNVDGFHIDYGDGDPYGTDIINNHTYDIASQFGFLVPTLVYWAENHTCETAERDTLYLKAVRAFFDRGINDMDTAACYNLSVDFINNALGANTQTWFFGDGTTSTEVNPSHTFSSPGNYEVMLQVIGLDCKVEETKNIYVYPPPTIGVESWNEICFGDTVQFSASGGIEYTWSPDSFLSNTHIPNPVSTTPYSLDYNLQVVDTNDCVNDEIVSIFVQQTPEINLLDTTIIVGQSFELPDSAGYNIDYFWTPDYGILNQYMYSPGFNPLESTLYTVTMFAYANGELCDTASAEIFIDVLWEFTLDMPMAFTPNGDGVNDQVYVRGWGIRQLIDFKIVNRWGEIVFQTDDINLGWDGIYKGQLQASDTYVYDVEVETFDDRRLKKKGSITLMR